MCIVTREVREEAELIRFVRSPDGLVVPDLARKLLGRGVWVCVSREKVAEVVKRNLFARGFGEPVTLPEGFVDLLSRELRKQAVATLSLARKAGEALAGFMKVEEAIRKGPVRVLLHAEGAGADGVSKLNRMAREATIITTLSPAEMDLAFGRPNVIHAAVATGGLAEKLVFHLQRMAQFENSELGIKVKKPQDE
jgi:uncharacterized protein